MLKFECVNVFLLIHSKSLFHIAQKNCIKVIFIFLVNNNELLFSFLPRYLINVTIYNCINLYTGSIASEKLKKSSLKDSLIS